MTVAEVKAIFGKNFEDEEDKGFDVINKMLIKDTYQVSGNAYHEFLGCQNTCLITFA